MINHLERLKTKLRKYGGHCAHKNCTITADLTVDHVIPRSFLFMLGFIDAHKTDEENLQILCRSHNVEKDNLLDYTNPKTLSLLKKYINLWIEKHSDYFIDPAKRVRKLGMVCLCHLEEVNPLDVTKWKNPPSFAKTSN